MAKSTNIPAPDLTQRPPRSPRSRLGGYALLPRMLDKGRATLAGKNGEYHYNCPLDQHILNFAGIDAKKLLAELKKGKGDGEILEWITANAKTKRSAWEIQQWSDYHDRRGPDSDAETLAVLRRLRGQVHQDARRHQNVGRPARTRRLLHLRRQSLILTSSDATATQVDASDTRCERVRTD